MTETTKPAPGRRGKSLVALLAATAALAGGAQALAPAPAAAMIDQNMSEGECSLFFGIWDWFNNTCEINIGGGGGGSTGSGAEAGGFGGGGGEDLTCSPEPPTRRRTAPVRSSRLSRSSRRLSCRCLQGCLSRWTARGICRRIGTARGFNVVSPRSASILITTIVSPRAYPVG